MSRSPRRTIEGRSQTVTDPRCKLPPSALSISLCLSAPLSLSSFVPPQCFMLPPLHLTTGRWNYEHHSGSLTSLPMITSTSTQPMELTVISATFGGTGNFGRQLPGAPWRAGVQTGSGRGRYAHRRSHRAPLNAALSTTGSCTAVPSISPLPVGAVRRGPVGGVRRGKERGFRSEAAHW